MNKRIALICKGKSLPTTGKDCSVSKLESLTNNVERVETVLRDYGNWVPYIYEITTTTGLKDKINEIKGNGVDEFLFYYTGHGRGSLESFEIIGVDECDIDLLTLLKQTAMYNKSVSIILDACESLAIVDNWSNPIPYEIITSASDDSSYEIENIAGDGKWYSYFSHHFCEYMKRAEQEVRLADFNKYLIGKYDEIAEKEKQESNHYLPTINRHTKINTIVYGKQFYAIRALLKRKYPILNDFKRAVLCYVSRGTQMYERTLNTKSVNELISLLINKESSGYLYCLLKSENMLSDYTENFTGDKCCTEYNHQINKIMVIVNHNKVDDVYDIGFYVYYDNNHDVGSPIWIKEVSWDKFFTEILVKKLEDIIKHGTTTRRAELVMVLPFEKLDERFELLEMIVGEAHGHTLTQKLNYKFDISMKLFTRLADYFDDNDFIIHWKEYLESAIEDSFSLYINKYCHIENNSDISIFKTHKGRRNLFLLKDYSLSGIESILSIYINGVPFMATVSSNHCDFNRNLKKHWKDRNTKVKDFGEHTHEYLKARSDVCFLYDDGYDEKFLMDYNQRNSEENNYLGEEDG